ncbi:hypothetical protein [Lysinibacillus fusiformis]
MEKIRYTFCAQGTSTQEFMRIFTFLSKTDLSSKDVVDILKCHISWLERVKRLTTRRPQESTLAERQLTTSYAEEPKGLLLSIFGQLYYIFSLTSHD